jgi:hypothetical protein
MISPGIYGLWITLTRGECKNWQPAANLIEPLITKVLLELNATAIEIFSKRRK